jgi:hypothetical protein
MIQDELDREEIAATNASATEMDAKGNHYIHVAFEGAPLLVSNQAKYEPLLQELTNELTGSGTHYPGIAHCCGTIDAA